MKLNAQIIKKNREKEFVILPYSEFLQMKQSIEDYKDLVDLRKAKTKTVNEPSIPYSEVAKKINKSAKKLKERK
jgi:hypothetical protein